MKKESLKILQHLSDSCGDMSANEIRAEIQRIALIETPKTTGKFDLYSATVKPMKNRITDLKEGICYRGGFKAATNAIELYAVNEDYPADMEGWIIDRTGNDISNFGQLRFPSWEKIIPDTRKTGNYREFSVDLDAAVNFQREVKARAKVQPSDSKDWIMADNAMIKFGDALFRLDRFINFAKFCKAFGLDSFSADSRRPAVAGSMDAGHVGLLMPIREPLAYGPILEMAV